MPVRRQRSEPTLPPAAVLPRTKKGTEEAVTVRPQASRAIRRFPRPWTASTHCGVILMIGLALTGALGIELVAAGTPATEPLAEVNGDAITTAELERALGAKL